MIGREVARLEVLHRSAGRVRVGLHPAEQSVLRGLVAGALRIVGVHAAEVGASRRNLVVSFDPRSVTEENLLMRLGLDLSARLAYAPVQVVRQRIRRGLHRGSVASGGLAAAASLATVASPAGQLAALLGWLAALSTLATVGGSVAADLGRGRARPEGLSLVHLMSRLGSPDQSFGVLLTWLLYHGNDLAEQLRGGVGRGVELRPVMLRSGVGEDREGTHMEILTRPVQTRGALDGALLTPASVAAAAIGYLAYSLQQGFVGRNLGTS